jgi:tRNA G18 (ribose-2'-O)-methylase SpoU
VVALENLVDVDNVGALVRTAAGFGADAVLLSPGCADPYYRKAIRVSMGAVFTLPVVRATRWPDALRSLHDQGMTVLGAALDEAASPLSTLPPPSRVVVLLGSEGPGVTPAAKATCDVLARIPMDTARADSLNVVIAGAIFLYHLTGGGYAAPSGPIPERTR